MRESRLYGSVRGVAGDRYPYRDWCFSFRGRAPGISQGPAGRSKLDASPRDNRSPAGTVQLGKTGAATDFLPLEIGWLSQRFAAFTEQSWDLTGFSEGWVEGQFQTGQTHSTKRFAGTCFARSWRCCWARNWKTGWRASRGSWNAPA